MRLQESKALSHKAPALPRSARTRLRSEKQLFDLVGTDTPGRAARAYLVLLLASLAAWALIAYAIFVLVSAIS